MDLAYLRDLLSLLSEYKVQAFVRNGMQIAFREEAEPVMMSKRIAEAAESDDGGATSARRVGGFNPAAPSSFRHSKLWQGQNGKVLNFMGELE